MSRHLPDWISGFEEFTKISEPPALFKTWVAVSTICSAMQRTCWTTWEDRVYPNMYIVLVGPSGCRKGTAMRPARKFLAGLGLPIAAEAITREALIRSLGSSAAEITIKDEVIRHCSLTIFSPELTVFLGQNNWQLISDLNDWFDCLDEWNYETKNSGTDNIMGVWVNILGATTPEFLQSALPNDAIGGGLAARIVFVFGDKKSMLCPAPFTTTELEDLAKLLHLDISKIATCKGEFKIDKKFLSLYIDWYIESEKNPPFTDRNLIAYCDRRATHLRKLCMVMSISRSDELILEEKDFIRAEALLRSTEEYMHFVFAGRGRSPQAQVVEQIKSIIKLKKYIPYNKLLNTFLYDCTKREFNDILSALESIKFLQLKKNDEDTYVVYNPDWEKDLEREKDN